MSDRTASRKTRAAAPPCDEDAGRSARWVCAGRLDALDAGSLTSVVVAGHRIVLVRDGDRIFAAERACPHEGADLARGRYANGKLFCARHFVWFTLEDGAVCPGWRIRRLRIYPVRLAGTEIYVDIGSPAVSPEAGA